MTTVNNRKVSLPPRKDERVTRNVPPPSGKSEDPKLKGFFDRQRKGGKSFWDWLDLIAKLAIPIVVLLATIGFGWWQVHLADLQHQSDQQSALDQQRAVILQTYIDNI